ncbi:[weak similarity to] Site-specific recombinase Gcr, partial [methanotrophic bacterial endosymbiont of Bathymodiolus sp.]
EKSIEFIKKGSEIYHRIPDRIRKVPWLRRRLGVVRANKLADYLSKNTGALAGNFFSVACWVRQVL